MNFFERQRQVKRMSGRLVLLFVAAVLGIVLTIDLIAVLLFGGLDQPIENLVAIVLVTSVIVATVIGLSSLFKMIGLRRGGGGHVARSLGARPVPEDTTDPQLRRFRNVVEEVAIASGVPVPELFVLENEPGINAFAAGWSPADAAVAVTRGALEQLNRDELQGVIGHEFSHVVNGDMRLNIRLMGLLFGILVLAILGRILLRVRGGQRNPVPLIGLALVVAGFAGLFIGRIIKAAVSRQREFLADASAVQFTRQTAGLTGALKKIAGVPAGSNLSNPRAEDVSHMLFGAGKGLSGLFATHPPLFKRIKALDPSVSEQELAALRQRYVGTPPSGLAEDRARGLAPPAATSRTGSGGVAAQPAGTATANVSPAGTGQLLLPANAILPAAAGALTAAVGAPAEQSFAQAGALLNQIPQQFRDQAHDPSAVVPLVFGLLLSEQPEVRANQHATLATRHGQQVAAAAWQAGSELVNLHPALRLPLAELAFPVLRRRPRPEQDAIMATVHALIHADGRLSVSEYCLSRLLHAELYEAVHHVPPWGRRRYSLAASRTAASTLLAVLAHTGNPTAPAEAQRAFESGAAALFPQQRISYAPPPEGVAALEPVWPALDGLNPVDKELLLQALVAVISHDGQMTVAELELLRTICALLHCPLPQLVDTTTGTA